MANFRVPRERMDKKFTCSVCIKTHMPFVLYERGLALSPSIEKRILATEPDLPQKRERWLKDKVTISKGVGGGGGN